MEKKEMIKFLRAFVDAKKRNIILVELDDLYQKAVKLLKHLENGE